MQVCKPQRVAPDDPRTFNADGSITWAPQTGDSYRIVGERVDGSRFATTRDSWRYADGINLYRGRVYLVRGGRRFLVKRVWN